MKKILGIMALIFSFTFTQSVFAAFSCGEGMSKMVDSLKLDEAQKAKIKPALEQLKSTAQSMRTQMDTLDSQINQMVENKDMDKSAMEGLVDKKAELIGGVMKAKMNAKNQIISTLTPEQKTKFQNMITKMKEKMKDQYKNCQDDD